MFTNESFLFIPLITIMFRELEINGKNQHETAKHYKLLNLTVPSGAVPKASGTQPSKFQAPLLWPVAARHVAFVIV